MEKLKNEIKDIIIKLGDIRKIPQFLFLDEISPLSTKTIRDEIIKFKSEHEDINEIDFIINSPGGSADDAYRIIRTLRQNFKKVNIIVAFWAKSAATLLSLGGSNIIMDDFAEFGPLDVQIAKRRDDSPEYDRESALIDQKSLEIIEERSQTSFMKTFLLLYNSKIILMNKNELTRQIFSFLSDFYEPLLSKIDPYRLGDKKRKLDIGARYAKRILENYNPKTSQEKIRDLVENLVNGCPDHGYVIDFEEISRYLSNVVKSDTISIEYKNNLRDLSGEFMIIDDDSYIGFINKEIIEVEPEDAIVEPEAIKQPEEKKA